MVTNKSTFEFDNYEFYNPMRLYDHHDFLEEFKEHSYLNADKIKKMFTELVYVQVITNLNEKEKVIT